MLQKNTGSTALLDVGPLQLLWTKVWTRMWLTQTTGGENLSKWEQASPPSQWRTTIPIQVLNHLLKYSEALQLSNKNTKTHQKMDHKCNKDCEILSSHGELDLARFILKKYLSKIKSFKWIILQVLVPKLHYHWMAPQFPAWRKLTVSVTDSIMPPIL